MSLALQYTIIALLMLGAVIWVGVRVVRSRKRGGGSCCGCSLADTCSDIRRKKANAPVTPSARAEKRSCCQDNND